MKFIFSRDEQCSAVRVSFYIKIITYDVQMLLKMQTVIDHI